MENRNQGKESFGPETGSGGGAEPREPSSLLGDVFFPKCPQKALFSLQQEKAISRKIQCRSMALLWLLLFCFVTESHEVRVGLDFSVQLRMISDQSLTSVDISDSYSFSHCVTPSVEL